MGNLIIEEITGFLYIKIVLVISPPTLKIIEPWFKAYPETKAMLWGGHLWTPSYFMSTVGSMSTETVKKYIENQLTEYNDGRPRT